MMGRDCHDVGSKRLGRAVVRVRIECQDVCEEKILLLNDGRSVMCCCITRRRNRRQHHVIVVVVVVVGPEHGMRTRSRRSDDDDRVIGVQIVQSDRACITRDVRRDDSETREREREKYVSSRRKALRGEETRRKERRRKGTHEGNTSSFSCD